jgi:hypothetical protein
MSDFAVPGDIITGLAGAGNGGPGCRQFGSKASITTVASFFYSGWTCAGTGGTGAAPGAWAIPNAATTGCWVPTLVDVSAGTTNRLLYTSFTASNISNLILVDRIGHMGGMSGTVATAQSTGASMTTPIASGRCASTGSDVLWCLEWYTATGATPVTATISYTNQSGASGKTTTLSLPATVPAYRVYPVTVLAAGDTSILTIDSITLSGTTGTAGSFGVTAYKILQQTCIPVANTSINTDWAGLAMPLVAPQVCFSTLQYCTAVTYGTINYQIVVGTH